MPNRPTLRRAAVALTLSAAVGVSGSVPAHAAQKTSGKSTAAAVQKGKSTDVKHDRKPFGTASGRKIG